MRAFKRSEFFGNLDDHLSLANTQPYREEGWSFASTETGKLVEYA
jgi:hypothetical protein